MNNYCFFLKLLKYFKRIDYHCKLQISKYIAISQLQLHFKYLEVQINNNYKFFSKFLYMFNKFINFLR